jgi:uroporphyrin-3 C-methyltransferase
MLPPEQRYFLIQNLRLKLEAAKAALLGRNQAFFHDNLVSAAAWAKQYFAPDSPEVRGFLQQLETLAGEQIAPPLPDITDSLRRLEQRRAQLSRGGAE